MFDLSGQSKSIDKKLAESILFNLSDSYQSEDELTGAKIASTEKAEQEIWQGIKSEEKGDLKLAIAHYRQAIESDPECAKAYQLLSKVLRKVRQQRQNKPKKIDIKAKEISEPPVNFIPLTESTAMNSEQLATPDFSNVNLIPTPASTNGSNLNLNKQQSSSIVVLPDMAVSPAGNLVLPDNLSVAQVYIEQALAYFEQKQWDESIAACQEALRLCPNLGEAYKVWGNCLQQSGRSAEAIGIYAKALEVQPNMAEIYCNLGSIYAKRKKWQQAIAHYQKSIIIEPRSAAPYRNLARVWDDLGEYEKSATCFFKALEIEPTLLSAQNHFELGNNLVEEGNLDRAIACYKQCLALDPKLLSAYVRLSEALEKKGEIKKALFYYKQLAKIQTSSKVEKAKSKTREQIRGFLYPNSQKSSEAISKKRVISLQGSSSEQPRLQPAQDGSQTGQIANYLQAAQQQPDSPSIQIELGNLYFRSQEWQNAINCYFKAIKLAPDIAKYYINLGKALEKVGENSKANQAFYQGFSRQPSQVSAKNHYLLGNKLLEQGQVPQAGACYRQAISLKPDFTEAYVELQKILLEQQKYSQAISCCQQLIKNHPNDWQSYHYLGEALSKQKQWSKAVIAYQNAVRCNSEFFWSQNNLGNALLKLQKWQEAEDAYRRAISINPDFVWSYQNLGEALFKQEKWQQALTAYTKTLKLRPDLPWTYYNLGDTLGKLLRWKESIVAYSQAIKLEPDFAEAYSHLGDALVREEKWQEAIKSYEKAIEINPGIDISVYRNLKEAVDRKKYLRQGSTIEPPPMVTEQQKWPYSPLQIYQPPDTLPDGSPWPKISIVTPSYNQGEFIEETILSVIHQNYPGVEHILIDGGSNDKTMNVVNKYREYFTYVVSEPDNGQSDAINKGFRQAKGEIFTWLNSDDRLAPGALYAIALAFYNSGADAVAGICQIFQDGEEIEQHLTSCANGTISLDEILDIEGCWLQGKFFYQPEVMFTRAIWEKAGGKVNESLYYSMDYEMWARFAVNGAKLEVIGYPIAQYRIHELQKTSSIDKYQPELLKTRDLLRQSFNLPGQVQRQGIPTRERKSLKIVCLNDTGSLGGAGIAHQRIAQALILAGHQVFSVAGTLDWSLTPVDCTAEEVERRIASLSPDLLVIGNIHNFQYPLEILEELTSKYPTVFVMHDQWLLTGRCGYTGGCEAYTHICNDECPTWEQYPCLAPDKIADVFTLKQALLRNNDRLLILGDSKWLTNWSRYAYINHASPGNYDQLDNKFQHLYYGLDLEVFRPQDKTTSRRKLGLQENKFIILTGSQSLEDERKGVKYLLRALEIANLPDILVLCFGHNFHLETQLEIQSIGYIDDPSLLATYYSAGDLFISPALEEAFGQTFIEAAACGTPAVGYGVGGVKEAIGNRVSGRIVNQKTPEALAKTIQELYHDRPQLELLSKLAPWYVASNFSMASSYHSIINAWEKSEWLSDLGMTAVSKFTVKNIPQHQFLTIKGGSPRENFQKNASSYSLPRKILIDQSLQGTGWHRAEKVNGVSARWMEKLGTVIVEPIDFDSSQYLQLEVSGITAVDLNLLHSILIRINGNLIATTVQHQDNQSWICRGDIPPNWLPQRVAFLVTIEVPEVKLLSSHDSRKGSLLVDSLSIRPGKT